MISKNHHTTICHRNLHLKTNLFFSWNEISGCGNLLGRRCASFITLQPWLQLLHPDVGPDTENLKTHKCRETSQIDFIWLKEFVLVTTILRFFPLSPNSVLKTNSDSISYNIGKQEFLFFLNIYIYICSM